MSQSERSASSRADDASSGSMQQPNDPSNEPERVNPDDRIVLRPDLARSDQGPEDDQAAADAGNAGPTEIDNDSGDSESTTTSAREPGPAAEAPSESRPSPDSEPETQPRAEPGPPAESPRVSMGDWVVQVASFGSDEAASQVRTRLEALGHIVKRDEIVRGQSLLYRLRTGPYPSREAAEQALAQISATVVGVEPIVREIDDDMQQGLQSGFAVQVGSFVSRENAESETARLTDLGFESFRFSEQIGERLIWRVMVGPVATRGDADALKSSVVEQAGVEGLVVSYP